MPTPLTILYTPGYVWQPGEIVTIAKLNLAANPTLQLTGTISSTSIADGAITPAKLNVSVAGNGLTGGGGAALSVATDSTLTNTAGAGNNLLGIARAGVTLDKLAMIGFLGATAYAAGLHGIVPQPLAGQQGFFLCGNGTWADAATAAATAAKAAVATFSEIYKATTFY